jgi:hypothetical protein
MTDPRSLTSVKPDIIARASNFPGAGAGPGGQPTQPAPVVFPPEFLQFPGSVPFNRTGSAQTAGPNGKWAVPASIGMQVPPNNIGVVNSLEVGINNMTLATNIVFALRINRQPVQGFDSITLIPRVAAYVGSVFAPIYVLIPQGAFVDVMITVVDNATYLVGASFYGWYYSKQAALQYAAGSSYK